MRLSVNMYGLESSGEMFLYRCLGSPKFRDVHRSSCSRQGPEHKSRKRALCQTPPRLYYPTPNSSLWSPGFRCYHLLTENRVRSSLKISHLEIVCPMARVIHGLEWTFWCWGCINPENTMNLASCAKEKWPCLNWKVLRITWTEMCGPMTGNKQKQNCLFPFSPFPSTLRFQSLWS